MSKPELPNQPEMSQPSGTPRIDITALFADGRVISKASAAGVAAALAYRELRASTRRSRRARFPNGEQRGEE